MKGVLLLLSVLCGFSAYAQSTFTVKLKLVDSSTSEPVGFATASLTVKSETTAEKYVLTDAEGAGALVKVRNNTLGRYIILSLTYRFGNFGGAAGRPGPGGPMGPPRR